MTKRFALRRRPANELTFDERARYLYARITAAPFTKEMELEYLTEVARAVAGSRPNA